MVVAGAIGGALWAAIPALLRVKFNANEILVSLMLVYVADLVVKYLVFGPWRDPGREQLPDDHPVPRRRAVPAAADAAAWEWLEGTRLNTSLLITLAALPLAWMFMQRSFFGFQLTVGGTAPGAARSPASARHARSGSACSPAEIHRGHRGRRRDRRAARADLSDRIARLWLCGDHRGVRRPAAPAGHPARRPADVVPLPCGRQRADDARTPPTGCARVRLPSASAARLWTPAP